MIKMTRRNKIVLFSSVFLALCIIASVIVDIKYTFTSDYINIRSLILVIIIILLSIISIPVVYFGKIRRNRFEKMLNDEYFQKYEIIKDAVINSQLPKNSKKEIREDILDILISAQKSGRNAEDVIENPEEFSRNILLSYAKPGRLTILSIIDGIVFSAFFILGGSMILWLEQVNKNLFEIAMDTSILIFMLLISFIILPLTKKLTSTHNYWMFLLPIGSGLVFILVAESLRMFFPGSELIRQLLDGSIRMIPNTAILIIYIVIIVLFLLMKSYLRKLLLKK
jgi:hypothetical protein